MIKIYFFFDFHHNTNRILHQENPFNLCIFNKKSFFFENSLKEERICPAYKMASITPKKYIIISLIKKINPTKELKKNKMIMDQAKGGKMRYFSNHI